MCDLCCFAIFVCFVLTLRFCFVLALAYVLFFAFDLGFVFVLSLSFFVLFVLYKPYVHRFPVHTRVSFWMKRLGTSLGVKSRNVCTI